MKAARWATVFLPLLAGCNTDPVFDPRQDVDGPTTRIDRPDGVDVPDIQIANADEVDLVEQVLSHRAQYHRSLKALHDFYQKRGSETKRTWAAHELEDVNRIKPFRYLLSAEIPSDRLTARDSIAEADVLYDRGVRELEEGGHGIPFIYREKKLRDSLATFKDLIERFPTSDKIDDAAFQCGEIHKEYFKNEEPIALRWYERAFTWNPQTPHPARFQAAVVYDYRLHDRDRALELYHQVLKHETFNESNVSFSVARIAELTREEKPEVLRGRR
ncbi:MAG: hypothetical protein HOP29_13160 [Phycisphaerales bacterium]|nr:hypothetical protein [Phycisphaerales bacterium]